MNETWGSRLNEAIQAKGFNKLSAIAAEMNVNESTVSRWSNGGNISISHALQLCDILHVSMDWLFRGITHAQESCRHEEEFRELDKLPENTRKALFLFINTLNQR